jgi:hypothetical protein
MQVAFQSHCGAGRNKTSRVDFNNSPNSFFDYRNKVLGSQDKQLHPCELILLARWIMDTIGEMIKTPLRLSGRYLKASNILKSAAPILNLASTHRYIYRLVPSS